MDIIFAYTRAQAIADGVLIDVTQVAREAGFSHPTAVTQQLWSQCVAVPKGATGQDEQGRLWDVLWMLGRAVIRTAQAEPNREVSLYDSIHYELCVQNGEQLWERVTLKAVCGPGDNAEPVITIMLPHED